ncbi:hypothetical protein VMCG_07322 [Cytospora schulzeri]|uniref:Major facilitator superfamily (MFS) profile domain-containing protein n=1 Tax=Cytospora schulzeri TaxID=448051 RepID=A0A423WAE3_9PEZI|nr:hypothetical protein VMCG_07322 [Valsa malicola]
MSQKEAGHLSHDMASSPPSTPPDEQNGGTTHRPPAQLQPALSESYLSGFKFGLTLFALLIAVFCVALDSTIISTAIPRITDEFHNLHDRAVAGIGAAGVTGGSLVIIAHIVPMEKRPTYQSLTGAAVVVLLLKLPSKSSPLETQNIPEILWSLDPLGFIAFVPSIVCVLLALEWGGTTYAWNSGQIIALFIVFGVTLLAFVGIQTWLGEKATIPARIATQRTVWSACIYTLCLTGTFFLMVYFIPIYFQAVKGVSALQSGIDTIPLIVPQVLALIMAGILTSKLGYYMPFIYIAVVVSSIAAGLLTTLRPSTTAANWIGYQILFGFGIGCGFQLPQIAAQTVLPFKDIPTGIAITLFFQSLGGSIFVSAGNNVLNDRLVRYITALKLESVNAEDVIEAGATAWRSVVPAESVDVVVDAYSRALRDTFRVGLITVCLSCIGAAFMEWKSVRRGPAKKAAAGD